MAGAPTASSGYGSGSGYGYGYGSGYGDGDGDGYGYGYGSGSGYGYGYGYGDGDGDPVGTVAGRAVTVRRPWGLVSVGCQTHTPDWWREHWRAVARSEGVDVDESEVMALLERAVGPGR